MRLTFQLHTIVCALDNNHSIKYLLQVTKNFWMVFGKFSKTKAVAFGSSFFSPYQINVANVFMVQCAHSFTLFLFEEESNSLLCLAPKLGVYSSKCTCLWRLGTFRLHILVLTERLCFALA